MSLSEFGLIEKYFSTATVKHPDTRLGIGDDCALIAAGNTNEYALTTDTLVEGSHFFPGTDPGSLGHKALAVNLSDLAAMGAEARWASLALTLPDADDAWLRSFAEGFFSVAERYRVELIGGDTTRGPRSITVQVIGAIPQGTALTRRSAQVGDLIFVNDTVGDAGLALTWLRNGSTSSDSEVLRRLSHPSPQLENGLKLRGLASACIDISDGLLADLGHILKCSGVGARVDWEKIPLSSAVRQHIEQSGDWQFPLASGEDYALCFTLPEKHEAELTRRFADTIQPTCIGTIEHGRGCRLYKNGQQQEISANGFQHFPG